MAQKTVIAVSSAAALMVIAASKGSDSIFPGPEPTPHDPKNRDPTPRSPRQTVRRQK